LPRVFQPVPFSNKIFFVRNRLTRTGLMSYCIFHRTSSAKDKQAWQATSIRKFPEMIQSDFRFTMSVRGARIKVNWRRRRRIECRQPHDPPHWKRGISRLRTRTCKRSPLPGSGKIQLGAKLTSGLGAGLIRGWPARGFEIPTADRSPGRRDMVFVCAGLGGGPVRARLPIVGALANGVGRLTVPWSQAIRL